MVRGHMRRTLEGQPLLMSYVSDAKCQPLGGQRACGRIQIMVPDALRGARRQAVIAHTPEPGDLAQHACGPMANRNQCNLGLTGLGVFRRPLVGVSLHFSCAYADVSIAHRPNGGASSDQAYVAARGRVHDTPWWYSQIVNKEDCD